MTRNRKYGVHLFLATSCGLAVIEALAFAAPVMSSLTANRTEAFDANADTTSCKCPELKCKQGTLAACSISCVAPKVAHCSCDAACKDDGNTSGSNRCGC